MVTEYVVRLCANISDGVAMARPKRVIENNIGIVQICSEDCL